MAPTLPRVFSLFGVLTPKGEKIVIYIYHFSVFHRISFSV
jgi:hypothetical protein